MKTTKKIIKRLSASHAGLVIVILAAIGGFICLSLDKSLIVAGITTICSVSGFCGTLIAIPNIHQLIVDLNAREYWNAGKKRERFVRGYSIVVGVLLSWISILMWSLGGQEGFIALGIIALAIFIINGYLHLRDTVC